MSLTAYGPFNTGPYAARANVLGREKRDQLRQYLLWRFVDAPATGALNHDALDLVIDQSTLRDQELAGGLFAGEHPLQTQARSARLRAGSGCRSDGAAFLLRARRIVDDATAAADELAERRGALAGPLRLSAPVTFGTLHLGPALCGFLSEHPRIELTLDLDDRFIDIAADGYDAVVRHGPVVDAWIVVQQLAASRRLLVASPKLDDARSRARWTRHRVIAHVRRASRSGKRDPPYWEEALRQSAE